MAGQRNILASPGTQPVTSAARLPRGELDLRASIRPTVAEVDLGAIVRNAGRVAAAVGEAAVWAVIKADAYGHGAVPVARALAGRCSRVAVSLVEEALELRAAGLRTPITVLSAYYDHCHGQVLDENLTPVVYDQADLALFSDAAVSRGRLCDVHIKVETGMNRLGIAPARLRSLLGELDQYPGIRLAGLSTHLASADAVDEAATARALSIFRDCVGEAERRGFTSLTNHAANSAGAIRFPAARFQAVRPGLALYGAMPSAAVALPGLEPALRLSTRIMAIRDVAIGETVSYGGEWRAQRNSVIATLPIGYADGYPRHVRRAETLLRGKRIPVVGVVCMDMMMVDVTDVPGAGVGDEVTLLGADRQNGAAAITADDLAGWAGTINYEILCGISKRVPRVYKI
ncbi:MAG TPA: alanine racemase [Polyangia bacterium]|nr:alanine racemase [Polyangia bacterium]